VPTVEWVDRDGRLVLRVTGADVDVDGPVAVYPASLGDDGQVVVPSLLQPMAGTSVAEPPDAVVFVPRYPFVPGTAYTVATGRVRQSIRLPAVDAGDPVTSVVAIRPAVDVVPRNLLRLYVEFSGPMSEGVATRCVRVVDGDTGELLADALLPMEPELWDPARRRLTVLFDPGRIKRGLAPHLEAGYPLVEGRSIEVVVDAAFLDASGRTLVAPATRRYRIGGDLRGHVDPSQWVATAAGKGAVRVEFDRPLDVGLLAHCLVVVDGSGGPVVGDGDPADDGRSWTFEPDGPLVDAADWELRVDPILEDVAGNSVSRVFDRDLAEATDDPRAGGPVFVRLPA
jgi:hypothetical protein